MNRNWLIVTFLGCLSGIGLLVGLSVVGLGGTANTATPTPAASSPSGGSTAAGGNTATGSGSAAAGGTAAGTASGGGNGQSVTLVAKNISFDKTDIKVKSGPVTITFNNQDSGTFHNLNVFNGKDASAPSLGMTDVARGPVTQTLSLNLKPGSYYFQCDVHPDQMKGTITAS